MNQLLVAIIGAVVGVAGALIGLDLQRAADTDSRSVVFEETVASGERPADNVEVMDRPGPPVPLPDGVEIASVAPTGESDAPADGLAAAEATEADTRDDTAAVVETDMAKEAPVLLLIIGQVRDRETFMTRYADELPALYTEFGGEGLAAGEGVEALEGLAGFETYLVSRWPNREAALAFWESEAHEALRQARVDEAWGEFDTLLLPARAIASDTTDDEASLADGIEALKEVADTVEETVEDAADDVTGADAP